MVCTPELIYTPSAAEIAFVKKHSRTPQIRACMLTQLKCAQRLGHFIFLIRIPRCIPKYIAKHVGCRLTVKILNRYDNARARAAHIIKIRAYLNIKPATKKARSIAFKAMEHAAFTKEDIVDVFNVGIEELIRLSYELPRFDHLNPLLSTINPQRQTLVIADSRILPAKDVSALAAVNHSSSWL